MITEYEWWPMDVYTRVHGGGDPESRGHSRVSHRGQQGVAVYRSLPGVITIRQPLSKCFFDLQGEGRTQPFSMTHSSPPSLSLTER